MAQRLVQIGRQEGLAIEGNAAELLVEQAGNDIRQCINAAQVDSLTQSVTQSLSHSVTHSLTHCLAPLLCLFFGSLYACCQMWKAQSNVMRYTDLRAPPPSSYQSSASSGNESGGGEGGRLRSIEKDKILRQSPFDACGLILGGRAGGGDVLCCAVL